MYLKKALALLTVLLCQGECIEISENVHVLPGKAVKFLCSAKKGIRACNFGVPGFSNPIELLPYTVKDKYAYYGKGFERGECGISLKNVTYNNHGQVYCSVRSGKNITETGIFKLRIIRPKTILKRIPNNVMILYTSYNFTCISDADRPNLSKISWYLDDIPIINNAEVMKMPHNVTGHYGLNQTLSIKFNTSTFNSNLKCSVSDVHGNTVNSTDGLIKITFPPIPADYIIYTAMGVPLMFNISFCGNPKPKTVFWQVNFTESPAEIGQINNTYYFSQYVIDNVTKEDFQSVIFLIATNSEGTTRYRIFLYPYKITSSRFTKKTIIVLFLFDVLLAAYFFHLMGYY